MSRRDFYILGVSFVQSFTGLSGGNFYALEAYFPVQLKASQRLREIGNEFLIKVKDKTKELESLVDWLSEETYLRVLKDGRFIATGYEVYDDSDDSEYMGDSMRIEVRSNIRELRDYIESIQSIEFKRV